MTDKVVKIDPPKTGRSGDRTILTPKEPVTHQSRKEIETLFSEAMNQQKTMIILDCKSMPYIDSAGLELLVEIDEKLRTRGGLLKIVGLNELCKEILVATRLIGHFHVYEDIREAISIGP
jgi:anti-anti-sigma factor